MPRSILLLLTSALLSSSAVQAEEPPDFARQIAPLLTQKCLACHNPTQKKGELDLSTRAALISGGESGLTVSPGKPGESLLIDYVSGDKPEMPKTGEKLSRDEVALLTRWVAAGLPWPEGVALDPAEAAWWSLRPLKSPAIPRVAVAESSAIRTPIDAFIGQALRERGLPPSPEADRRTLIRRLKFDLLGLPPTPEEVAAFVNDSDPLAYEKLIDRYLDSPQYGERWARHWLDVAHYGDTHGYDKDKLRPNAWPYRDYVIRAFNDDKPYARFIREQIAGDVLFPDDPEGIVATGFIAAGPWDFISHVEVPESKLDGKVARSLDRDDMVRTVMETFNSATIGCARCHDHKFDPFTMEDYYSLQAVFAAVDRADRPFDADAETHHRRRELLVRRERLSDEQQTLSAEVQRIAGERLRPIDAAMANLARNSSDKARPEFGYHSQISSAQDATKWVQIDLGKTQTLSKVVFVGCHDDFNNIGAGFGFPVRYKVEAGDDAEFKTGVVTLLDRTGADVVNPGVEPQTIGDLKVAARYVRVTATKLAPRQNDFIFALAELQAFSPEGENLAAGKAVTALDSIEAPVRWGKANLVDGYYFGVDLDEDRQRQLARLGEQRREILREALDPELRTRIETVEAKLAEADRGLSELPAPGMVYAAATDFAPQGNFVATKRVPREIRILARGNITSPGELVMPGALHALDHLPARFELSDAGDEGARRTQLAEWIAHPDNPLTWRSLVNRVWLYHFGRGLVDSPNDFGRMGQLPSHPELLDWLAVEFRDGGGSIKNLHRLICRSAVYRQTSEHDPEAAAIDAENVFYWRMNRRRLEAEAIRDAILFVSGKLDATMYGPGFHDFAIEKPEHSPHFQYGQHDPNDPASHRRAVYRFVVRSQQQPFMTALDCADPSMQVEKRIQTVTSLQALALLNDKFVVAMSEHFANRLRADGDDPTGQVRFAFRLALGREPTVDEVAELRTYSEAHGLDNLCRVLFNLNEFVFID